MASSSSRKEIGRATKEQELNYDRTGNTFTVVFCGFHVLHNHLHINVLIGDLMENTHFTKAQRMGENMVISMAIQEAINQTALTTTPEQKKAIEQMIATLAGTFKPAES